MDHAIFPLWAALYLASGAIAGQAAILLTPLRDPLVEPHPERVAVFTAGAIAFLAATWTRVPPAVAGALSASLLYTALWAVTLPFWRGLVLERLGEILLPYLAEVPGVAGLVVARVERRLGSVSHANRARWIRLLASLGSPRAARALEGRLADRFQTIRGQALEALAGLDATVDPEILRRALERDLEHCSLGVRVQAVRALRDSGAHVSNAVGPAGTRFWLPARPELCRVHPATGLLVPESALARARDPEERLDDPGCRHARLLALAESEPGEASIRTVRSSLEDPCGDVVYAAITVLGLWGATEAAADLERLAAEDGAPERLRVEASRAALSVLLDSDDPPPPIDPARLLDFFQAHVEWEPEADRSLLADLARFAGRPFESHRDFLAWAGHPAAGLYDAPPPDRSAPPPRPPAARIAVLALSAWLGALAAGSALAPAWESGIYLPVLFPIALGACLGTAGRWGVGRLRVPDPTAVRAIFVAAGVLGLAGMALGSYLLASLEADGPRSVSEYLERGGPAGFDFSGREPTLVTLLACDLFLVALVAQAAPVRAASRAVCPGDGEWLAERVVLEPPVLEVPEILACLGTGRPAQDAMGPGRYRHRRNATVTRLECPSCSRTPLHRVRFPRGSGLADRVVESPA